MIRSLFDLLYGSTPAEFKSAFGLGESVARLQAATRRSFFLLFSEETAAGRVSAARVRLQRVIPMVGNAFKPFFVGRFEARGSWVYLTGAFTMHWFTKLFLTAWFGLLLSIGVIAVLQALIVPDGTWVPLLGVLAIFGLGVGFVLLAKWFSRNDVAWLSDVMRRAVESPAEDAATSRRSTL